MLHDDPFIIDRFGEITPHQTFIFGVYWRAGRVCGFQARHDTNHSRNLSTTFNYRIKYDRA